METEEKAPARVNLESGRQAPGGGRRKGPSHVTARDPLRIPEADPAGHVYYRGPTPVMVLHTDFDMDPRADPRSLRGLILGTRNKALGPFPGQSVPSSPRQAEDHFPPRLPLPIPAATPTHSTLWGPMTQRKWPVPEPPPPWVSGPLRRLEAPPREGTDSSATALGDQR